MEMNLFLSLYAMSMSTNGSNPWFASTVGLAGLIVGYVLANGMQTTISPTFGGAGATAAVVAPAAQQQPAPTPPPSNAQPATAGDGPVLGKASAPITLIEFTDFQCPFCARHTSQTFDQIKKDYVDTGKVKYVVRHFPLGFHPNAVKASEAAACADDQGKFWDMHAALFKNQDTWSPLPAAAAAAAFKKYAADSGMNTEKFNTCFDSGSKAALIAKDTADGSASGIDGTPGFWILGPNDQRQQVKGAFPYATFQTAFDSMLK